MRKITSICSTLLVLLFLAACSSSGGDDTPVIPAPMGGGDDDPVVILVPTAATLVFPEDNTECNEGEAINDMESRVTFDWDASENTDSYVVTLTNLDTEVSFNTIANGTEAPITILRGTPYEWYVTSSANGTTETTQSSTAKFYNAGPGISNYAPFPAAVVFPLNGTTLEIASSSILLEWTTSDIDSDIKEYDVFFGIQGEPLNSLGVVTVASIEATVTAGAMYEWYVVTTDEEGNSSISQVFSFQVG